MPARRDLKIIKGSTFSLKFRLSTQQFDGSSTALDLTGSVVALRIESSSQEFEYASGTNSEIVISDATNGEVTFTLASSTTTDFPTPKTRAKWSLELRTSQEDRTLIIGNVTFIDWANP